MIGQPQSCKTCRHAHFERTATGLIRRKIAGQCRAEPEFRVPSCMVVNMHRKAIWPAEGASCALWAAPEASE